MATTAPRPCMGMVEGGAGAFVEPSTLAFDAAFEE